MIELTQHIEKLLLENDFVIIPDFGGFVAHYNQAQKSDKENTFCPPTRSIGFNPHLTLNDGLLVQSYMSVHDTDFSGATKMVNEAVKQLVVTLHEDGKVELPHIGELHYTIHRTYDFIPYNERVITPSLYGLQTFVMQPLSELQKLHRQEARRAERSYNISLNKTLLRNAVAAVVAVITFYTLSIPIENTYMAKGSYAQLLPIDVFETIQGQSVLTTPVKTDKDQNTKSTKKSSKKSKKNSTTTTTTTTTTTVNNNNQQPANNHNNQQPANNQQQNQQPVNNNNQQPANNQQQPANNNQPANNGNANQQPANNNQQQHAVNNNNNNNNQQKPANSNNQQSNQQKPATNNNNSKPATTTTTAADGKYHVIVASSITRTKAEELVAKLKNLGYTLATILDNGSTIRVSVSSSTSKEEANKAMNQIRTNKDFKDAWVMNYNK